MPTKKNLTKTKSSQLTLKDFLKLDQFELFRFSRRRYANYNVKDLEETLAKKRGTHCYVCPKDNNCTFNKTSKSAFFEHVRDVEKSTHRKIFYLIGERKVHARRPHKKNRTIQSLKDEHFSHESDTSESLNSSNSLNNAPDFDMVINSVLSKQATKSLSAAKPKAGRPKSNELKSVKPKAGRPKSNELKSVKSKGIRPKLNELKSVKSKAPAKTTKSKSLKGRKSLALTKLKDHIEAKKQDIKMNNNLSKMTKLVEKKMTRNGVANGFKPGVVKLTPVASEFKITAPVTPKFKPKKDVQLTSTPIQLLSPVINFFQKLLPFSPK